MQRRTPVDALVELNFVGDTREHVAPRLSKHLRGAKDVGATAARAVVALGDRIHDDVEGSVHERFGAGPDSAARPGVARGGAVDLSTDDDVGDSYGACSQLGAVLTRVNVAFAVEAERVDNCTALSRVMARGWGTR